MVKSLRFDPCCMIDEVARFNTIWSQIYLMFCRIENSLLSQGQIHKKMSIVGFFRIGRKVLFSGYSWMRRPAHLLLSRRPNFWFKICSIGFAQKSCVGDHETLLQSGVKKPLLYFVMQNVEGQTYDEFTNQKRRITHKWFLIVKYKKRQCLSFLVQYKALFVSFV